MTEVGAVTMTARRGLNGETYACRGPYLQALCPQASKSRHDGIIPQNIGLPHPAICFRYSPGKLLHNLGNAPASDDAVEGDPQHPMRLNWCGIINVNEFIWFQLTKV
jgi:hypothetical protein